MGWGRGGDTREEPLHCTGMGGPAPRVSSKPPVVLMQALEHVNVFVFVRQRGRSGHGAWSLCGGHPQWQSGCHCLQTSLREKQTKR